jgi:hypothetical protein
MMEGSNFSSIHLVEEILAIVNVGIVLAKTVFAVRRVNEAGDLEFMAERLCATTTNWDENKAPNSAARKKVPHSCPIPA